MDTMILGAKCVMVSRYTIYNMYICVCVYRWMKAKSTACIAYSINTIRKAEVIDSNRTFSPFFSNDFLCPHAHKCENPYSFSVALLPIALWILVYICITLHSWVMMLSLGNKYVNNSGYKGIKSNGFHQMQWPNYSILNCISLSLSVVTFKAIGIGSYIYYLRFGTLFSRTKDSLFRSDPKWKQASWCVVYCRLQ